MSKLYALFDYELNQKHGILIEDFVKVCYKLDASIIQYRDKVNPLSVQKNNLTMIRKLWDRTLLINDNIELGLLCDGIHIGQEDLANIYPDKQKALIMIRDIIGSKIIGLSTHNQEEIVQANSLDVDYIGLGAYRDTQTKKDITAVLGNKVKNLAKLSTKPVAIIGGVKVSDEIDFATYKVVGSDLYLYY